MKKKKKLINNSKVNSYVDVTKKLILLPEASNRKFRSFKIKIFVLFIISSTDLKTKSMMASLPQKL